MLTVSLQIESLELKVIIVHYFTFISVWRFRSKVLVSLAFVQVIVGVTRTSPSRSNAHRKRELFNCSPSKTETQISQPFYKKNQQLRAGEDRPAKRDVRRTSKLVLMLFVMFQKEPNIYSSPNIYIYREKVWVTKNTKQPPPSPIVTIYNYCQIQAYTDQINVFAVLNNKKVGVFIFCTGDLAVQLSVFCF